ncbi:unnamed protein product [Heligmosomoides polygyrus]|uniref:ABC transporter ATP-binding protein n=1 Tax=Heligmosomoides polygyrus TaxID=6339 RepID=A0A183GVK4_HELPZ|nr:unnamed protein product [Heligmosomoides polygyrus]
METFLKSWKAVSWENVQLRVDGEIKAIGARQDEAEEGRKVLVDESNKYRENTTKVSLVDCLRGVFWIYPSPGGHITKEYVKNRLGTNRATPTEHDRT